MKLAHTQPLPSTHQGCGLQISIYSDTTRPAVVTPNAFVGHRVTVERFWWASSTKSSPTHFIHSPTFINHPEESLLQPLCLIGYFSRHPGGPQLGPRSLSVEPPAGNRFLCPGPNPCSPGAI